MSGPAILRSILASSPDMIAVVPAARIACGKLPLNSVMPAILINKISGVPYLTVKRGTKTFRTDRVQVTALIKDTDAAPAGAGYPSLDTILRMVRDVAPRYVHGATVAGVIVDSVVEDSEGPDLPDPAVGLYSRSQDFFVRYSE